MKKIICICIVAFLSLFITDIYAQSPYIGVPMGDPIVAVEISDTDTIFVTYLHEVIVFPPENFKTRKQEQFYWRTVRDVKKTLPYAKLIAIELNKTNEKLSTFDNDKERRKYLAQYEKEVFRKYESDLRKMSITQGKILLKLINRQCEQTPYELIKGYRGTITAYFWQGVARLFGSNLKDEYDGTDKDRIIERVIILVEAGRL